MTMEQPHDGAHRDAPSGAINWLLPDVEEFAS